MVDGFGGGSLPFLMGIQKTYGLMTRDEFDLSYFPEPTDDKALLALGLMREGRGLNHPAYAFLSFYRVLEVAFSDGKKRADWISSHVDLISDLAGREALAKLQAHGVRDVGQHLRKSGRGAIAHARVDPIIDPDEPSHNTRLWSELPIMAALAHMAIEEVLGVETSNTVWKKHLYELAGFKEILGPAIVDHLMRGDQITDRRMVNIPKLNIEIWRREPYAPLANMVAQEIGQNGNALFLSCGSDDGNVQIRFKLDFSNERLEFDIFDDVAFSDAGTPEAAEAIAEIKRFSYNYFCNGQLHIYNAENGTLISRKDAYLPKNMLVNHQVAQAEITRWKRIAEERREFSRGYWNEMVRLSMPYVIDVEVTFSVEGF